MATSRSRDFRGGPVPGVIFPQAEFGPVALIWNFLRAPTHPEITNPRAALELE